MGTSTDTKRSRIRLVFLFLLCLQNATYTLCRRYSTGILKEPYSSSSVLLAAELIKLIFSLFMMIRDVTPSSMPAKLSSIEKIVWTMKPKNSIKMLLPAVTYLVMNLLSFVALQGIDAGTFVVLAQTKILTTAVFAVILLGKKLSSGKWRALFLLVLGVVLIGDAARTANQSAAGQAPTTLSSQSLDNGEGSNSTVRYFAFMMGCAAVLTEVMLSGFISIYFEKVIKSTEKGQELSIWQRNVQLATFSACIYGPLAIRDTINDGLPMTDIFHGWSKITFIVACLGSAGGLLVALSVKYSDSILKTFAVSGAIVLSTITEWWIFDGHLNLPIIIGCCVTILSIFNYNTAPAVASLPSTSSLSMNNSPSSPLKKPSSPELRSIITDRDPKDLERQIHISRKTGAQPV